MAERFRPNAKIRRTKLVPPLQHKTLLERQHLCGKLADLLDRRLMLVSAPAGYGKTSLLAQIYGVLTDRSYPCAWLSLEPSDNDFVRFLTYVVEALRVSGVSLRNEATAVLNAGLKASHEIVAATLFNALASIDRDVYFFIDDYHVIHDLDSIRFLGDILTTPSLPLHFIIGARNVENLPIVRLRSSGLLQEIDSDDLKFSSDEALKYFEISGGAFRPEQVVLLHQQTEGWIAGLQLASLAVSGGEDPADLLETLSGERKAIAEFLLEEVLRRQPSGIQRFLLDSSILNRFDADLCNAVMERGDSAQMIERIRDGNLFLFGLDKEERWFRFHHLFSQAMRRRLYNESPARYAKLHLLACESLAKRGLAVDAIDHAFSAGAIARAGELLDSVASELFASGETGTLRSLAKRLPDSTVRRLPRLQLELAWDAEIGWEFAAASEALANVRSLLDGHLLSSERAKQQGPVGARMLSQLVHREMMLAEFRDDLVITRSLAEKWLAQHEVYDPFMQASVGTTLILCDRELGYCDLTLQTARDLRHIFEKGNAVYGTVFHGAVVGTTLFAKGELQHAETALSEALQTASRLHGAGSPLAAMPAVLLAEVLYEQNRLGEVRDILEVYGGGTPELGFADNVISSFLVQAKMARIDGAANLAKDILHTGRAVARRLGFARMDAAIACEQMANLRRLGSDIGDRFYPVDIDSIYSAIDGGSSISLAVDLATMFAGGKGGGKTSASPMELMQQLYNAGVRRNNLRVAVRAAVQLALLASTDDWHGRGRYYTCIALRLSQQHGFVRTLVDEGVPFLSLLNRMLRDAGSIDFSIRRYAGELVGLAHHANTSSSDLQVQAPQFAEPILPREIEILNMALESRTNAEIADMLNLSENTIKWYWQRIFNKLDVRRRQDAIQRARKMNVL